MLTLTFECLKKGLSSFGAYLSNYKERGREKERVQIKNISTKSKASVTKNMRELYCSVLTQSNKKQMKLK